jgi:hypothetical protein
MTAATILGWLCILVAIACVAYEVHVYRGQR